MGPFPDASPALRSGSGPTWWRLHAILAIRGRLIHPRASDGKGAMDDDALTPGLARVTEFLQHHCFEVLTIEDRRDQGPVLTMETRRQGQRHRLCLTRGLLTSAMLAQ